MNENNSVSVSDFISSDKSQVFNCEVHLTQTKMTKCEADQIVNPYRLFTVLIMSSGLVWVEFCPQEERVLVAHAANLGERCVQYLVGKPE